MNCRALPNPRGDLRLVEVSLATDSGMPLTATPDQFFICYLNLSQQSYVGVGGV